MAGPNEQFCDVESNQRVFAPDVSIGTEKDDIKFEGPLHAVFGERLIMQIPHQDFYEEGCNYTFRLEPYTYRTLKPPAKFMTGSAH